LPSTFASHSGSTRRTGLALAAALFAWGLVAGPPAAASIDDEAAPKPVYGRKGESSVGVLFGVGWYDNTDFNAALVGFGVEPIENGFEFGLQFRSRLSSWFSLGAEIARLDGRSTVTESSTSEFGIAGTTLFLDGFVHPLTVGNGALTLFAGAGPVVGLRLSQTYPGGDVASGSKLGFGWHGGAEGEARFGENFAFFVRGLVRRANASDIVIGTDDTGVPILFDADFNGAGVSFGPRWYFGGQGAGAP